MITKNNSFWLAIQYISTLVFSFVNLKLNLSHFGKEIFGIWIIIVSVWGLGAAIDFGFGTALIKFVAEKNEKNKNELNKLVSSSFFIFIILGLIVLLMGLVFIKYFYFTNQKLVPSYAKETFATVYLILGGAFYLRYLSIFYKSIMEGHNDFILSSKITIIGNLFIFVSVLIVSSYSLPIQYLAVCYLLSTLLTLFLFMVLFRLKYPMLRIKRSNIDITFIKDLFGFGVGIQGANLLSALIDPLIKYIIGSFYMLEYVSIYEIARRFSTAISGLFYSTFRNYLTKASILTSNIQFNNFLDKEAAVLSKMGIIYSGFMFGTMSIIIATVISFWFGMEEAILIFLILSLPESINNFGYSLYIFLIGIGKSSFLLLMQLLNVIIITISLILGFYLFKNILGLLAYYITVILVNFFMIFFLRKRYFMSISDYMKKVNIHKLLILNIFMIFSIFIIFSHISNFYLPLITLSMLSIFLFYRDFKKYFKVFIIQTPFGYAKKNHK